MSSALDRPPNSFLRFLPKAELHLHLEGAIEPPTLVELRQRRGERTTRGEVDALYRYEDFPGFLLAFKNITEHLRTADDYELITYRLMQRLKEENVLHAEVYVSVGVCLWRKQDFAGIFEGLDRGRARGARDSATLGAVDSAAKLALAERVATALGALFVDTGVPVIAVFPDGRFAAANRKRRGLRCR